MENVKKLILLVDDRILNLHLGKIVFKKKYNITTVPSAKKMFEFLEKNKPDIILLDIDMPEMNGIKAMRILRSKTEIKNIPVIFLSSCIEANSVYFYRQLGAVAYVSKPFYPFILFKRIGNLLDNIFTAKKEINRHDFINVVNHNSSGTMETISSCV